MQGVRILGLQNLMTKFQVICVTDLDCPRNDEFHTLMESLPDGRMVDFYTTNIDDLSMIAKYRILPVPTILVLNNSRVVMRLVKPPEQELLAEILQSVPTLIR
jgi:hypothetical protein